MGALEHPMNKSAKIATKVICVKVFLIKILHGMN